MMKQRSSNSLISYVGMKTFSLTPGCLEGELLLMYHQEGLCQHLKLWEKELKQAGILQSGLRYFHTS
jgi:hypothetical protein